MGNACCGAPEMQRSKNKDTHTLQKPDERPAGKPENNASKSKLDNKKDDQQQYCFFADSFKFSSTLTMVKTDGSNELSQLVDERFDF